MKKIVDILGEHSFFQDISKDDLEFIAGCGKNVIFNEKEMIARPGNPADKFYLIRQGHAALILEIPPFKPFIYQTIGENEILGLSWLIPPYRWTVAVQAMQTLKAIEIDGACIREKCEKNPILGFKLMKHLVQILVSREEAARLHLLDVYGNKEQVGLC